MQVQNQAEANALNARGEYGPYRAANGHLMVAPLRYPRQQNPDYRADRDNERLLEREYRVGDLILYDSWAAWCAPNCNHDAPPEDW
jgi:hypothetical protein